MSIARMLIVHVRSSLIIKIIIIKLFFLGQKRFFHKNVLPLHTKWIKANYGRTKEIVSERVSCGEFMGKEEFPLDRDS